jgi:hypothetical protein
MLAIFTLTQLVFGTVTMVMTGGRIGQMTYAIAVIGFLLYVLTVFLMSREDPPL